MLRRKIKNKINGRKTKIYPIISFLIGLFFFLSCFFSDNIGILGVLFINIMKGLFGETIPVISLFIILTSLYGLFSKRENKKQLYASCCLFILGILITFHLKNLSYISIEALKESFIFRNGSGLLGSLLSNFLYNIIGGIGLGIILFLLYSISIFLFINFFKPLNNNKYNLLKKDLLREKESIKINNNTLKEDCSKRKAEINISEDILPKFNIQEDIFKKNGNNINYNKYIGNINNNIKWKLPPISLLKTLNKDINRNKKNENQKTAILLKDTLGSFGIKIQVKEVSCGPSLTRYEAMLEPGTKVSKIQNLGEDIALALAATSVRIEAPIPGKSAVGFEIPNKKTDQVSFKELIVSDNFLKSTDPLTIGLGKDITGKTVIASLGEMPHMLIAGATGSGKSVCLNTLICSLLFKYTPEELRFLLIDTKKVELTPYNNIPHLISPVVTDAKRSAIALKWMVSEMESRYEKLSLKGVRDIKNYNEMISESNRIPYVVIIIDELADLMMAAPIDVETSICRIAQKARAAGIHLIVATQRPSVQVITGDIKSNIPRRIAFAVFSQIDARTILDTGGAEKLLGKGDMLYTNKGGKLLRIQGAFISEDEIISITEFLKKQGSPEYFKISEDIEREGSEEYKNTLEVNENDPLLKKAAQLILENNQASISMLQRKLKIGYSRGARLIDILEEKGFVGISEGTKSREILGNWEDFGNLF